MSIPETDPTYFVSSNWTDRSLWLVRFYGALFGEADHADKNQTVVVDAESLDDAIKVVRHYHDELAVILSARKIMLLERGMVSDETS